MQLPSHGVARGEWWKQKQQQEGEHQQHHEQKVTLRTDDLGTDKEDLRTGNAGPPQIPSTLASISNATGLLEGIRRW